MIDKNGHSGFRVPDGYFDKFPARMEARLKATEGNALPKEAGFSVPDAYFDTLGERLQRRLEAPQGGSRTLWTTYLGWAAAAAAGLLMAISLWPARDEMAPGFSDLAGTEIEQYLEVRYDDLSSYDLAESLPLDDLAMGDLLEDGPGENQILDYLDLKNSTFDDYYLNNDD